MRLLQLTKELIERFVAVVLLIILSPLILIAALLIQIESHGPMLYSQTRVGTNGRTFKIWKLRTMVPNSSEILDQILAENGAMAKEYKAFGSIDNDPRITGRVGLISREFSIDELLQLLNIIKGEMSFVGPRPQEPFFTDLLKPQQKKLRLSVKPGLSGLWQIVPRSSADIYQMMKYDSLYINRKSTLLDLWIIYRTLFVIFKRTGH